MGKKPKQRLDYDPAKATYRAWVNMILRCHNPTHVSWAEYGGRGIRVHPEWLPGGVADEVVRQGVGAVFGLTLMAVAEYQAFKEYVGIKPTKRHSLDRIDPNGNYAPGNVRWATPEEQGVNKRVTAKMVRHPETGEPVLAASLARELGITYQTLRIRMVNAGTWNALDPKPEPEAGEDGLEPSGEEDTSTHDTEQQ